MTQVAHVFFDVPMGRGFPGLSGMLYDQLRMTAPRTGECAVFLNTQWNAAKILFPEGAMIYWRNPSRQPITYEHLKALPMLIQGELRFQDKAERRLARGLERKARITIQSEART